MSQNSAPPGWGTDSLTAFLEEARRNRFATFAHKAEFNRLIKLDACFLRVATDWLNPEDLLGSFLLMRAHSAFRAACEHATAGQVAEVFPQIRASLEYAGYALHLNRRSDLAETWLRRHDDQATMQAVKQEFTIKKVRATIAAANQHAGRIFDELYQRSIDFGAHPNERSVTGSMSITDVDAGKRFDSVYLHGDGLALDHALRTTAQAGVCALDILSDVFPARFELLGVRTEVLELRKGL